MSRRRFRLAAALGTAALALVPAGALHAQRSPHPETSIGGPPSLPAGDGTIRGVVVDADHPEALGDLPVALYALQPDGTPGIGGTQTAADGSFSFEGVATDAGIVYLVGVRYQGVPWGERTGFVADQREIDLMIPVERPTTDGSGVRVLESTFRIEALGTRIAVLETHSLRNTIDAPVYVAADTRKGARPPFSAGLPDGALDFETGVFNADEAFEQRGVVLLYWGPIYAGEQQLRFGYQLEVAPGATRRDLELRFPLGTGRVRVLTAEGGPRVEAVGLRAAAPVEEDGAKLAVLEGGARARGASLVLGVDVPAAVRNVDAVSLGRAEIAIELDDSVLEVTSTNRIDVAPGARVAGSPDAPLLRFELPERAEIVGLGASSDRLGARVSRAGIDVLGPLGPGEHELAFRYRLPAVEGAATLDLRFPLAVRTLLLRAADTGLVIESDRLHRLRPQAMGTRTWLLREAFDVRPDEQLAIRFESLRPTGPSRTAGAVFVVTASAFVLLFVVGPLRRTGPLQAVEEHERSGAAHERDLVYATIRDLEHDFETGKVSEADYQRSRSELRDRAIELMREEHGAQPADGEPAPASSAAPPAPVGRFCLSCGAGTAPAWRFCSHCGGALEPGGSAEQRSSEPRSSGRAG